MPQQVDLPRFIALWHDRTISTAALAEQLGITQGYAYTLAARHGLPRRPKKPGRDDGTEITWRDPTPAEIAQAKADLLARHIAKRRGETEEETQRRIEEENRQWHHHSSPSPV